MVSLHLSKLASVIVDRAREILPQIVVDGLPGKFPRSLLEFRSKNFIVFISTSKTDHTQPGRQITVCGQIIESRNELSVGQIAGGAKDHY